MVLVNVGVMVLLKASGMSGVLGRKQAGIRRKKWKEIHVLD